MKFYKYLHLKSDTLHDIRHHPLPLWYFSDFGAVVQDLPTYLLINKSIQLPTSAVNVTLLAFAVESRVAAACCGAAAAGRPTAVAIDRYLLPAGPLAANSPHAASAVE